MTDEEKKLVRAFESQTGNLVYYVIFNDIPECGKLYSFLFVSGCKGDWEDEWEYLKTNTPLVYVLNKDMQMFSDYGTIQVECHQGVLIRLN